MHGSILVMFYPGYEIIPIPSESEPNTGPGKQGNRETEDGNIGNGNMGYGMEWNKMGGFFFGRKVGNREREWECRDFR